MLLLYFKSNVDAVLGCPTCTNIFQIKTYEEKQKEVEQEQAATLPSKPECTLQQKQELEARIADLEMQLKVM